MPRILSIFLLQLLIQTRHPLQSGFYETCTFHTDSPPPTRQAEKGADEGGLEAERGKGGLAPFSLAAINGNKSSTLCAQLFQQHQLPPPHHPPEGPPTSSPPGPQASGTGHGGCPKWLRHHRALAQNPG